jgi:hypothetical protein
LVISFSLLLSLSSAALGQTPTAKLPCEFHGEILRTKQGAPVRFTSAEMKERATDKVDLSGFVRQLDLKSGVIVDVLIGKGGEVVCLQWQEGLPIVRVAVERALEKWTFKREEVNSKSVAYVGQLQFVLCNTDCGDDGLSMTLLK